MQFDRKITISAGSSRRAMVWQAQTLLISELWAKLQTPARGTEPLAEYLNMKKAQQDDLKDVGGFMAGTLSGPRRKANNVTGRDVITLDLDNIPPGGTEDVLRRVEGLSCGYCIYSTRKHSPAAPRLRVLLPLDRTASADEYEPIARKMAEYIGLELCDPTTFEVSRLMYWPSCCSDSQYIYVWKDKPLLSVKGLLGQYEDWRDCTLWPQVPGSKYDNMLILAGPQGIGKSTLLDKMSRGWFNDSIRTFEGKEASELLQGVWLVEIGELDAFRKTDVACIKQFLSLRSDRFRAAYGRHVKELPRCCVFFGTTNTSDYLRDRTGNRRFWPVDVGLAPAAKSVWTDLPGEIDQLWAEAMVRWQTGEPLFLKGEIEAAAKEAQEAHREVNTREGIILDFLERPVPEDWQNWPLDRRRMFWGGAVQGDVKLVPRDRVCALEVWCEALDGKQRDMRYSDTAEINSIIEASALWERARGSLRFGYCGKQRGFQKVRL